MTIVFHTFLQAVHDSSQLPMHPSQGVHGLASSDLKNEYQVPANGQSFGQGYGDVQTSQGAQYGSTTPSSSVNEQVGNVLVTTCSYAPLIPYHLRKYFLTGSGICEWRL